MVADIKIHSDVLQIAAVSDGRHFVSRQVSSLHTRVSFFWNGFNLSRPDTVNKENGNRHVWTWKCDFMPTCCNQCELQRCVEYKSVCFML